MQSTAERFEPECSSARMSRDHEARYLFAGGFVRGKTVLDIACGTGYGAYRLAKSGAVHVTGADISEESIEQATQKYRVDNLTYARRSMLDINDSDAWDIITSFESIEHVSDYMKVLANFYRALKTGGLLILSTPNRLITSPFLRSHNEKPRNPYHVREFSVGEIIDAIRSVGFLISEDDMYGQRQRRYVASRILRRVQKMFLSPDTRSSPDVLPLKQAPRYTVIVAHKA